MPFCQGCSPVVGYEIYLNTNCLFKSTLVGLFARLSRSQALTTRQHCRFTELHTLFTARSAATRATYLSYPRRVLVDRGGLWGRIGLIALT